MCAALLQGFDPTVVNGPVDILVELHNKENGGEWMENGWRMDAEWI